MADYKTNGKRAIPRHRVQSRDASSRQERAIEKVERRAGKKEIEAQLADKPGSRLLKALASEEQCREALLSSVEKWLTIESFDVRNDVVKNGRLWLAAKTRRLEIEQNMEPPVTVMIDGYVIDRVKDGAVQWELDYANGTVSFASEVVPRKGSTLSIVYHEAPHLNGSERA